MTANKKNIFRQESLDRIESPEKLDQYIKVSRPSTWVLLAGLLVIALGAGIWAFSGSLPETMSVQGVSTGTEQVSLFLDPAQYSPDLIGKPVEITLPDLSVVEGTVVSSQAEPLSAVEISEKIGSQWISEQLNTSLYSFELEVATDQLIPEGLLVEGEITVREVPPIEYLLN